MKNNNYQRQLFFEHLINSIYLKKLWNPTIDTHLHFFIFFITHHLGIRILFPKVHLGKPFIPTKIPINLF
jgi:hypothetical protein